MSDDAKEVSKLKKKKLNELSNAELRKLNDRQNLERNYKQLNPSVIKKGALILGSVAATLGAISGIEKNGGKIIKNGKKVFERFINKK